MELSADHTSVFKAKRRCNRGGNDAGDHRPLRREVAANSVRLALPQQDVVLFRAYRLPGKLDGSTEPRQECENVLQFDRLVPQRLEPFPNRPTTYTSRWSIAPGWARLLVRTYALPEWFWDRNMNSRQACDVLAVSYLARRVAGRVGGDRQAAEARLSGHQTTGRAATCAARAAAVTSGAAEAQGRRFRRPGDGRVRREE